MINEAGKKIYRELLDLTEKFNNENVDKLRKIC